MCAIMPSLCFCYRVNDLSAIALRSQTPARLGRIHRNQSHRETRCKGYGWVHPSQSGEVKHKCVQHSCVLEECFFSKKIMGQLMKPANSHQIIKESKKWRFMCVCVRVRICALAYWVCVRTGRCNVRALCYLLRKNGNRRLHAHRPRKLFVFFLRSSTSH